LKTRPQEGAVGKNFFAGLPWSPRDFQISQNTSIRNAISQYFYQKKISLIQERKGGLRFSPNFTVLIVSFLGPFHLSQQELNRLFVYTGYCRQSLRQRQSFLSQCPAAVLKQGLLPSFTWIAFIRVALFIFFGSMPIFTAITRISYIVIFAAFHVNNLSPRFSQGPPPPQQARIQTGENSNSQGVKKSLFTKAPE
jgi:hypothetical protein